MITTTARQARLGFIAANVPKPPICGLEVAKDRRMAKTWWDGLTDLQRKFAATHGRESGPFGGTAKAYWESADERGKWAVRAQIVLCVWEAHEAWPDEWAKRGYRGQERKVNDGKV